MKPRAAGANISDAMASADDIFEFSRMRYGARDFAPLLMQFEDWRANVPLKGLEVFDATPIFYNTFPKYAAMLAGGARLTVAIAPAVPKSAEAVESLIRFGVSVAEASALPPRADIVLDCGGALIETDAKFGYAELTKTGAARYAQCRKPVYLADDSRVKELETSFGTGDGFVRAMKKLGFGDFSGRKILLFGFGKVGRGIARACLDAGADLTIVDDFSRAPSPRRAAAADLKDLRAVARAAESAWCIVSATGVRNALAGIVEAEKICRSRTILANMGVEDEFGGGFPAERVLNFKRPLNFILDEPTRLKFIAPTLALHNLGALRLLGGGLKAGLNKPSREDENSILAQVPDLRALLEREI